MNKSYKNYGKRGIAVCSEWHDVAVFIPWALSNGYQEGLTIDRRDTNGNYEPSNCRWVTYTENNRNRRNNRRLTYNGMTHTLAEWAEITGIHAMTIESRLDESAWELDRALTEKPPLKHHYTYQGRTHTLREWAEITGIALPTLEGRVYRLGWEIARALTEKPLRGRGRKFFTYQGTTQHLAAWAHEYGIPAKMLRQRLERDGWDIARALQTPRRKA